MFYKFKCSGCSATYYGKTKRHFKVGMCEHVGVSALTGKIQLGFILCKAEQPLQGMELQEEKAQKRLIYTGNLLRKELTVKRCLLILDLKSFKS